MTINQKIKKQIVSLLKKQKVSIKIEDLEIPPSAAMGDLALPCFELAKKLKKNPSEVAKELAEKIKPSGAVINVKNSGPYLNFLLDYFKVAELLFKEIQKQKSRYGQNKEGRGQKIMIEYSQPNTHKEFHVGHLRNVCIGSSLVNVYKACGYKVIPANYIGDTGAHVAKTLWYLQNFTNESDLAKIENKGEFLGNAYAQAVKKNSENQNYKQQAQEILKNLEEGDFQLVELWQKTRKWSLEQFERIYQELGVNFDVYFYESEEEKAGKKMLQKLLKYPFIKKSEGAIIADLSKYDLGVLVLLRKDGTALYGLKDIPLAVKKFKNHKVKKSLYVMDIRQSQYLKQVFKILELMGFKKIMIHVPYEFVQLKSGVISSRTGNVVTYNEVKAAALAKVINETRQRHPKWPEKKVNDTAMAIVIAALKFGMLKSSNNKIITFDIDEALDVNGMTGPYLQYTYARLNSIFVKSRKTCLGAKINLDYKNLATNIEKELVSDLLNYPQVILETQKTNDPSALTHYLYKLAQDFNTFYHKLPVIKAAAEVQAARFELLKAIKQVLSNGMELLGLTVLEEM
ncbi:MAG TPA: arginine--tRNA ligase [Candidatus Uhrbacteria bacterium]|nr:arginine--tRNA ligase [Candidatus Uhrbacteria bacterium]